MHFKISKSSLLHLIGLAGDVTDPRAGQPILGNILLQVEGGHLRCMATDLTRAVSVSAPCTETKPGSLTLAARHLRNVIRTLPEGEIEIEALENSWARIKAARSEFKLMGIPAGDFPELPDSKGVKFSEVASHRLVDLIEKTLFSVSTDEARVNLNGALFECDGSRATMVSTDGHRLTKYSVELSGPKLAKGIVIPRKGLDEIRKALTKLEGQCELAYASGYVFVNADALALSVKLNAVTFPPYQQVVPNDHKRRIEVSRDEFLAALRQAVVIAPEKTSTVKLSFADSALRLEADNPELGAIKLEIGAEQLDGEPGPFSAGFNATYLIETLGVLASERVWIDLMGDLDPAVIRPVLVASESNSTKPSDFLAVVMPMRI